MRLLIAPFDAREFTVTSAGELEELVEAHHVSALDFPGAPPMAASAYLIAGNVLHFAFDGEHGFARFQDFGGALSAAEQESGWEKKTPQASWATLGSFTEQPPGLHAGDPWLYHDGHTGLDVPASWLIAAADVRQAVIEFYRAGGQRPGGIAWVPE